MTNQNQTSKPFSKGIVIGTVFNKEIGAFTNRDGSPGSKYLQFDVQYDDNSRPLRVRVMNSQKDPYKIKEVDEYIKNGDAVKVTGRLEYRNAKGRDYYTIAAYTVEIVNLDNQVPRAVFVLQGDAENICPISDERCEFDIVHYTESNGKEYVKRFPLVAYNDVAAEVSERVDHGFEVQVVGHIIQQLVLDEYERIINSNTELEVKELAKVLSGDFDNTPPF